MHESTNTFYMYIQTIQISKQKYIHIGTMKNDYDCTCVHNANFPLAYPRYSKVITKEISHITFGTPLN